MLYWINVTFPVSEKVRNGPKMSDIFRNEDIISQFPSAEMNGTCLTLSFLKDFLFSRSRARATLLQELVA